MVDWGRDARATILIIGGCLAGLVVSIFLASKWVFMPLKRCWARRSRPSVDVEMKALAGPGPVASSPTERDTMAASTSTASGPVGTTKVASFDARKGPRVIIPARVAAFNAKMAAEESSMSTSTPTTSMSSAVASPSRTRTSSVSSADGTGGSSSSAAGQSLSRVRTRPRPSQRAQHHTLQTTRPTGRPMDNSTAATAADERPECLSKVDEAEPPPAAEPEHKGKETSANGAAKAA